MNSCSSSRHQPAGGATPGGRVRDAVTLLTSVNVWRLLYHENCQWTNRWIIGSMDQWINQSINRSTFLSFVVHTEATTKNIKCRKAKNTQEKVKTTHLASMNITVRHCKYNVEACIKLMKIVKLYCIVWYFRFPFYGWLKSMQFGLVSVECPSNSGAPPGGNWQRYSRPGRRRRINNNCDRTVSISCRLQSRFTGCWM